MPRGGIRAGAGRKRSDKKPNKAQLPGDWKLKVDLAADKAGLTPLGFMLCIVRDEELPTNVRAAMAVAAAPYCHAKLSQAAPSKKEDRKLAAENGHEGTEWEDLVH